MMVSMAESSSAVVVSVSFRGVDLDRVERSWSTDDQPENGPRYIQRWTGSSVARLSTQTSRESRSLMEVLVEELAGELLGRAVLADLPKAEMRHLLRSA